jgi:hypothetical protein
VQKVGINMSVINEYGNFLENYFRKFPLGSWERVEGWH